LHVAFERTAGADSMLDRGTRASGVTSGRWRNGEWRVPVSPGVPVRVPVGVPVHVLGFMGVFQCSSIFTRAHA